MSMKKILMAAVAASAISAAGSAGAITLNGTTVGTTPQLVVTGTQATDLEPYYLATEYKYATMPTGTVKLVAAVTTGELASGQYLVSFVIKGAGSFDTGAATTANLVYEGTPVGATTAVVSEATANLVSFFVTVGAADKITAVNFTAPIKMSSIGNVIAQSKVQFAANLDNLTVDGKSASDEMVIIKPIKSFYAKIGDTPATNATASTFSDFRQFLPGANVASTLQTATIGSIIYDMYVPTALRDGYDAAGGVVFNSLSGVISSANTSDQADLVAGATATFGGTTGATESLVLGTNATDDIQLDIDEAIATSARGATDLTTTVAPVAGTSYFVQANTTSSATAGARLADSGYTAMAKPKLNTTTHNQPAAADEIRLGTIGYEGVTINAAWIGDGTNGFDYRIRVGNQATTPLGEVKVILVNPTATPTLTTYKVVPNVAPLGELIITSAQLKAALGAFGRSDLKVVVQGSEDNISAKLRVINGTTGIVNEQTLGFGAIPAQVQ
jgi:hypothetical protein